MERTQVCCFSFKILNEKKKKERKLFPGQTGCRAGLKAQYFM